MALIASASTFIAGGKGVDRHQHNGGGYLNGLGIDYDSIQTGTGGPVSDASTWGGGEVACDMTDNGGGDVRIELALGGGTEFANCVVGMFARIIPNAIYAIGRHRVIAVEALGQWIDIDLAHVGDNTCDIRVGGALSLLQIALDAADATDFDVDILLNITTTAGATVDDDTFGGDISKNTKRRVKAFNTIPGDMNRGGTYYQSPIDSYNNGIDTDSFVEIDAGGGAYPALTIDNRDNTVWENIYIHNTNQGVGDDALLFLNTPRNNVFRNCRFDVIDKIVTGVRIGVQFIDCGNGPDCARQLISTINGELILNGVWQGPTVGGKPVIGVGVGRYGTILGNVVIGGHYGIDNLGYLLAKNNVCYNQSLAGMRVNNAVAVLTAYNNIIVTQAGSVGILIGFVGGTVAYNDYNCIVDTTGTPLVFPVDTDDADGTAPVLGEHSIELDPLFNVAGSDFRLTSASPCLNAGMPTVGGPY